MNATRTTLGFTVKPSGNNDRRVTFIASTKDADSHGTRLRPRGCKSANFLRNPVLCWNHPTTRENSEPDDVIGRVINLSVTDESVVAEVEFEGPENKKAERIYQKVLKKWLKSVSVGMIPIKVLPADKDGIVDVLEWELRELSVVPVGSNPGALVRGLGFTVRPTQPIQVATALVRRQSDHAQLWGKRNDSGLYTTPSGKFNPDELPVDAMARELAEEADIRASKEQFIKLGVVDCGRAVVHCFAIEIADCVPSSAHDPDQEVGTWEWLQQAPPPEKMHARPNALERWVGARTYDSNRGNAATVTRSISKMNPADILAKLGLQEGAAPEAYAPALIKYLAGTDAEAVKIAVVNGLLAMLAPAAPSEPSEPSEPAEPATDPGADARAAAMDATTEEVRRLQARVAELEDSAAKKPAPKEPEQTPEDRADTAIQGGQWPLSQRAALVAQYKDNKVPYLHPLKTFTNRGLQFTAGGAAITSTTTKTGPVLGNDTPVVANRSDRLAIDMLKRAGVVITPEQFAAAKAENT